ncbi:MFS transporter [Actinomyces ruminicola]|uniref:Major Facilitator Superfamily protein n=1 Tax=Actinomyces ruminicola TaxID=332524 RepID=A0A1G9V2V2_9ACTO|nr:MFS transporter [Actinomyces ruminicola]SDM66449.1 Major Facilitator Superfamily protein [Actinomyces ruminicola]
MTTPPSTRHEGADSPYASAATGDGAYAQQAVEDAYPADAAMSPEDEEAARITAKFGNPRKTIWLVLIAAIGGYIMMMGMGTALQLRLSVIDEGLATLVYSRATSLSALLMLAVVPIVGALSDRTLSRFGRRRPWIVGGYLVAFACFLIIGSSASSIVIIAAYIVGIASAQAGFNAYSVIPVEGVPGNMRGRIMGFMGLCGALAMSAGSYIAGALVDISTILLMTVPPALAIITALPLLLLYKDPQHSREEIPQGGTLDMFAHMFVNPVKHPNFGIVWLSRFLAGAGMAAFLGFFVLYLIIGLHMSPAEAGAQAGHLSLMSAPVSIAVFMGSGWISDKLGMLRPLVALAAIIMAAGLIIAATSNSVAGFTVAWMVFAVGQPMYLTVDLALCAKVLPNEADAGKDMAVFGLALNLGNVLVPAIAPTLLGPASSNYPLLWGTAAVLVFAGALLMPLVRGVK